jgi:hypothetical protein
MLEYLHGRSSERKLRLFACACCRRLCDLLMDPRSQLAVSIAEDHADGMANASELQAARDAALAVTARVEWPAISRGVGELAPRAAQAATHIAAASAGEAAAAVVVISWPGEAWRASRRESFVEEAYRYCALLREVFGNPLWPVAADPAWLSWHDGTVVKLAQAAYGNRQLPSGLLDDAHLAVLADALEEAGCRQANILDHLRGRETCTWCYGRCGGAMEMFHDIPVWVDECSNCGGAGWAPLRAGHCRGCFVLDALLGRS